LIWEWLILRKIKKSYETRVKVANLYKRKHTASPHPPKWQEALKNLDYSSSKTKYNKPAYQQKDLSNQINPSIYTLFPSDTFHWAEQEMDSLTKSIDTDILKVHFNARIDTIKGIGTRSAIKISCALKIRNRIDDLVAHYISDYNSLNEVISKYVYSDLESVTEFIQMAAIQYKKKPRSFTPCYNRDIFFEIIGHIPQLGICINKYWRNYILNNPELRSRLPSRCITCGNIFKYHTICSTPANLPPKSHITPSAYLLKTPRISLDPLTKSAFSFRLNFTRCHESSWKGFNYDKNTWTQSWLPLYPLGGVGQGDLWVYSRVPEVRSYKWNHYDYWMIQKFFDGTDYAVRAMWFSDTEPLVPSLMIKMPRVKMVNAILRWDKALCLNQ